MRAETHPCNKMYWEKNKSCMLTSFGWQFEPLRSRGELTLTFKNGSKPFVTWLYRSLRIIATSYEFKTSFIPITFQADCKWGQIGASQISKTSCNNNDAALFQRWHFSRYRLLIKTLCIISCLTSSLSSPIWIRVELSQTQLDRNAQGRISVGELSSQKKRHGRRKKNERRGEWRKTSERKETEKGICVSLKLPAVKTAWKQGRMHPIHKSKKERVIITFLRIQRLESCRKHFRSRHAGLFFNRTFLMSECLSMRNCATFAIV